MSVNHPGFEARKIADVEVTATQEITLNQNLAVAAATATVEVMDTLRASTSAKQRQHQRRLDQNFVTNVAITAGRAT
jgi:hypothetical protein